MNPESNELRVLVQKITDLPTLPAMMATITRLMQDPRTSAEELGKAIGSDPSMVSKVLKLVNSAFYGFPGRISTVSQAIVILGFSTIRNVVLTTSVLKAFGGNGKNGFDMEAFWEHSLLTGAIARSLAMEQNASFVEETFIAGLLHDMGRIVLSQKLSSEFEKVIRLKEETGCQQLQAEKAALGLTHGDIGAWLARKWNLPVPFIEVMLLHHAPLSARSQVPQSDSANLIYIVHAADALSKKLENGKPSFDVAESEIDASIREALKIRKNGWERFQARTEEEIGKARSFLEML